MNKKFSTLLAGTALLMGAVAVNAQTTQEVFWTDALPSLETKGGDLVNFTDEAKKGSYQIATEDGDSVLYVRTPLDTDPAGTVDTLKFVPTPASSDSLANTLWCVNVTENVTSTGETNYVWEFFNIGAQKFLDFPTPDLSTTGWFYNQAQDNALITLADGDSTAIGGDMGSWAFNKQLNGLSAQPLYSYFTKDSVVALARKEGGEGVYFVKTGANAVATNAYATKLQLQKAGEIILSAEQLNTRLGIQKATDGVKLTFKDKFTQNALADGTFFAENLDANRDLRNPSAPGDSLSYVYLYKMNGADTTAFLKVDTSYTNSNLTQLKLVWDEKVVKDRHDKDAMTIHDSLKVSEYKGQYMFLFTYKPSVDSINVYVKQASWIQDPQAYPYFSKNNGVIITADTTRKQNVRVYAADIVAGSDYILSVDSNNVRPQNTWITFGGAMSCDVADNNRTTLAAGLYVIKNAEGKVLAGRIDENGDKYRWVELSQQKPENMPAYQWLVLKNNENSDASTLQIINREFEGKASNVQLYKDGTAERFANSSIEVAADDVFTFEQIKDSTYIKDEHLGYAYFSEKAVTVAQYKFNYLNTLNMNRWLNTREEDSVLWAAEDAGAFSFKYGKDAEYGVTVDDAILDQIPGLAQLKRTTYVVHMGADSLLANVDNRYAVGEIALADSFYFKENNYINNDDIKDTHYYAIVKAYNESIQNTTKKAGISDIGDELTVRVEDLSEVRTSAFAIQLYDTPLYRTFNRAELGENADNSADSLLFRDWYRENEYLMDEHNEKWQREGMSYAGVWTVEKGQNKIGFRVDTARLNCDEGSRIKPQYLISVGNVVVEAEACQDPGPHFDINNKPTDKWSCTHATLGFTYGKYLVSFQDSVDKYNNADEVLPYVDVKGGYTRVGFIPAIRVANTDTLIFLVGEYENAKPEELNVNAIMKAYKDAGVDDDYIVALGKDMSNGNDHHTYTWSFRYITPEEALEATEEGTANAFLIESDGDKEIAPETGAWMKVQNGCLVLTKDGDFESAKTGGDGAMIFNAFQKSDDEDMATDNEEIAVEGVKVIAGDGVVTINGAAGKKVVVSNILGQVVANTVLTSDNATIAAPQGVVVVAVEGEEAVKAIVK